MKQLELNLQKRLLIIEKIVKANGEEIDITESMIFGIEKLVKSRFICKGSELTEEIAEKFVTVYAYDYWKNYNTGFCGGRPKTGLDFKSALDSFISAIESKGYYWGENPKVKPDDIVLFYDDNGCSDIGYGQYSSKLRIWREAEEKTFNHDKTLIFEIL